MNECVSMYVLTLIYVSMYVCMYVCMYRLMLQLDPRIRPSVEVLERLPSLQPFIVAAKAIVTEFKQQEVNMIVLLLTMMIDR